MAMVTISGKRRRNIFRVKRDIDGFRVSGGVLETVDHSFYVETGEKIMYNTDTKEVRIK
jgi:hypothetical protein